MALMIPCAQVRPIDHETGSHGVPGIYFKYDMSALKVIVNQASMQFVSDFVSKFFHTTT